MSGVPSHPLDQVLQVSPDHPRVDYLLHHIVANHILSRSFHFNYASFAQYLYSNTRGIDETFNLRDLVGMGCGEGFGRVFIVK